MYNNYNIHMVDSTFAVYVQLMQTNLISKICTILAYICGILLAGIIDAIQNIVSSIGIIGIMQRSHMCSMCMNKFT